jgi:TIR domain
MKRMVFISHSSQDKKIANAVCNFLEKHGVRCWMAPRDITPGKNYGAAIIDAISECEFFVLILSSLSNDSQQVVREVERAASTQSVVIPLRVEAVQPSKDLEFYVSSSHWLDAVTPPLDQHLMELLRAIEGWQKDEGQRRRRTPQRVENVATVAALDTPVPAGEPVKKRPGVWLYAVAATTILVACASVLLLKRSSSTTPTNREDSAALATPSPSAVVAEASPPQIAASTPPVGDPTPEPAPETSASPLPIRSTPAAGIAEPTVTGEEHIYSGYVGSSEATFRLRFGPAGRVSGTYTQKGRTFRLEGQNPTGKLSLGEYTDDRLTAHIELTRTNSAGNIRWEGTMHNTPPDNRTFPVSFFAPAKIGHDIDAVLRYFEEPAKTRLGRNAVTRSMVIRKSAPPPKRVSSASSFPWHILLGMTAARLTVSCR